MSCSGTEKGADFEEYLHAMAKKGTWGSPLELAAIGRMYAVKLVQAWRFIRLQCTRTKQDRKIGALLFNGSHFDVLEPISGKKLPKDFANVTDAVPCVPVRGGGRSQATNWTETSRSRSASRKRCGPVKEKSPRTTLCARSLLRKKSHAMSGRLVASPISVCLCRALWPQRGAQGRLRPTVGAAPSGRARDRRKAP